MWEPTLQIGDGDLPLASRLARAVVADIRRGRLRPGDRLPGTRCLADRLGVHRNTVLAAWAELRAEGWLEASPGRATRIAAGVGPEPPGHRARQAGFPVAPGLVWEMPPPARAPVNLAEGHPDLASFPAATLGRAWRRAVTRAPGRLLGYGDPRGHAALRAVIADYLGATRGLALQPDEVLITRGAQQAIDLTARALLRPGDAVAVEALGYRPAWAALAAAGARLLPLPVDEEGLDVPALEALIQGEPLRALYLTPHHQYPTTATLSAPRRRRLLALARAHRFAILEDDFDHEFHYEGAPTLPLASADPGGVVVYLGTLSKILAPGLRLGFVVAPQPLHDRLCSIRLHSDHQGDAVLECAVAELLAEGDALRHVRRMTRVYRQRRDALVEALRPLGGRVRFRTPPGGLCLWVEIDGSGLAWERAALARGVALRAGRWFTLSGEDLPFARLFFASTPPEQLRRAAALLGEALPPAEAAGWDAR